MNNNSIFYSCILSSITSSIITYPIDVIKVKYQTNVNCNVFKTLIHKVNTEGIKFFYKGSLASIMRNGIFISSKFYTYESLKSIKEPVNFYYKLCYGMSAGLVGATIGTPFDTIMVRIQNDNIHYPTSLSTIKSILKNEGIKGFWSATQYTIPRAMIVTSCQFAVFEQTKYELSKHNFIKHDVNIFITSSIFSSICSAFISNPIDVCKTRKMNNNINYKMKDIIQKENICALWKGVIASSFRQIPLNLIRFSLLDFYKKIFS